MTKKTKEKNDEIDEEKKEETAPDTEEADDVKSEPPAEDEGADIPEERSEETEETEKTEETKEDPKDKEIAQLKDQLLRNMAEYDNYRKRTAKERIEMEPELSAKITAEFLPVLDSIERALKADCSDENYKKGVEMIHSAFTQVLEKLGVETLPEEGEFNPAFHQAVQQIPAEEGQPSGQIASTFQKGYKIGNKVLRFAMVAVTE